MSLAVEHTCWLAQGSQRVELSHTLAGSSLSALLDGQYSSVSRRLYPVQTVLTTYRESNSRIARARRFAHAAVVAGYISAAVAVVATVADRSVTRDLTVLRSYHAMARCR